LFRAWGISAIIAPLLASVPTPAAARPIRFNVAAQAAVTGIPEFARQAGVQIVSPVSQPGTQRVHAVRGGYSVDAALAILLRGTGLFVAMRTGNVISLALRPTSSIRPARPRPNRPSPPPRAPDARTSPEEQPAIIVTGTRIARPGIDSAMPVTVRNAQTMRAFGYNGVYNTLVQSPAIDPGLGISNSQGEAWDVGISSINLRSMA
jgi:iron complex outermembrane receptor protein